MSLDSNIEHHIDTSHYDSMFTEFTTKIIEALIKVQTRPCPLNPPTTMINIKLDSTNSAFWSQVVEMYISGKDKLGYINGDFPQPPLTNPSFLNGTQITLLSKAS